ncbi:hypothetical protein D623_10021507 [Myotis brandtii]|uniref:Uncharacterized protein n=1 Tax=Myotis brandtii TaxID=109478 RepID=S7QAG5_MYOBR|nr:hypothetical protein D623_10021507 [Myotis brandtii]
MTGVPFTRSEGFHSPRQPLTPPALCSGTPSAQAPLLPQVPPLSTPGAGIPTGPFLCWEGAHRPSARTCTQGQALAGGQGGRFF